MLDPQDNNTNALFTSRPQLAPQAQTCQRSRKGFLTTARHAWHRCEGFRVRVGASTYTTPASAALYRKMPRNCAGALSRIALLSPALAAAPLGTVLPGRRILLGFRTAYQVGRLKLFGKNRRRSIHHLQRRVCDGSPVVGVQSCCAVAPPACWPGANHARTSSSYLWPGTRLSVVASL